VRAARFWAPLDVRIEDVPEPQPGPGELLLQVDAALTCGTDAKCYKRGHPILLGPAPARFGHEYAGTVVAAGEGAPFAPGDRVCGANSSPCGGCGPCRRGREELCQDLYPLLNGAYAELLVVPARIAAVNVHRIPDDLDAEVAAAVEPLACAVHAAEDVGAAPGVNVAVLGKGPLGRMIALACEARGATCELMGREDVGSEERYDAIVEAAGSVEAWERAIALAAPGATVVLFGGPPRGTSIAVDTYQLHYEGVTLRGSFHHRPKDVRCALGLITRNPGAIASLLTHEYALDDVVEPLRRSAGLEPREGLLKAVIRPWR
jgi:L-iditol 2-dehydrogenase